MMKFLQISNWILLYTRKHLSSCYWPPVINITEMTSLLVFVLDKDCIHIDYGRTLYTSCCPGVPLGRLGPNVSICPKRNQYGAICGDASYFFRTINWYTRDVSHRTISIVIPILYSESVRPAIGEAPLSRPASASVVNLRPLLIFDTFLTMNISYSKRTF